MRFYCAVAAWPRGVADVACYQWLEYVWHTRPIGYPKGISTLDELIQTSTTKQKLKPQFFNQKNKIQLLQKEQQKHTYIYFHKS